MRDDLEQMCDRPLLLVDVDGVISLFGFTPDERPAGSWLYVDGHPHLISAAAGEHLQRLARTFDLVWCTGWEDRANEHLLHALGLPAALPLCTFSAPPTMTAHWKLGGVRAHVAERPVAWLDDSFDETCDAWAESRDAPTLLVRTEPDVGVTAEHVELLEAWAEALAHAR